MRRDVRTARRARGMALIAVLVVTGILSAAMAGLVRSAMTSNRAASNVAFKQAATQAAEIALAAAEDMLRARDPAALDQTEANRYLAVWSGANASASSAATGELPAGIDWNAVSALPAIGSYRAQWVIERMCSVAPAADPLRECLTVETEQQGSQKAGAPEYEGVPAVYYRVTVRVLGPRATESFVQAALSR